MLKFNLNKRNSYFTKLTNINWLPLKGRVKSLGNFWIFFFFFWLCGMVSIFPYFKKKSWLLPSETVVPISKPSISPESVVASVLQTQHQDSPIHFLSDTRQECVSGDGETDPSTDIYQKCPLCSNCMFYWASLTVVTSTAHPQGIKNQNRSSEASLKVLPQYKTW